MASSTTIGAVKECRDQWNFLTNSIDELTGFRRSIKHLSESADQAFEEELGDTYQQIVIQDYQELHDTLSELTGKGAGERTENELRADAVGLIPQLIAHRRATEKMIEDLTTFIQRNEWRGIVSQAQAENALEAIIRWTSTRDNLPLATQELFGGYEPEDRSTLIEAVAAERNRVAQCVERLEQAVERIKPLVENDPSEALRQALEIQNGDDVLATDKATRALHEAVRAAEYQLLNHVYAECRNSFDQIIRSTDAEPDEHTQSIIDQAHHYLRTADQHYEPSDSYGGGTADQVQGIREAYRSIDALSMKL